MPVRLVNTPGTPTSYIDSNIVQPTAPSTGNITLIDFALWGPVNDPRNVATLADGIALFGDRVGAFGDASYTSGYNGNALIKNLAQALTAGNRNITLVRPDFGGVQASTTIFSTQATGTATNAALNDAKDTMTLTFSALPTGVAVGQAAWFSTVIYTVTALHTTTLEMVLYDANGDTSQIGSSVPTGAGTAVWTFATGLQISGAFPGAVGNSIKFKVTSANGIVTVYVKSPTEFGGLSKSYTSTTYPTLGNLQNKIGTDFTNVIATTLVYGATVADLTSGLNPIAVSGSSDTFVPVGGTPGTGNIGTAGTSISDSTPATNESASSNVNFKISVDESAATSVSCTWTSCTTGALIAAQMQTKIRALGSVFAAVTVTYDAVATKYTITSGTYGKASRVVITAGATLDCSAELKLGVLHGGTEAVGTGDYTYVTGTNEGSTNALKNPTAAGVSSAHKCTWYLAALGDPTDTATEDTTTFGVIQGYPTGLIVIPSLFMDDMLDTDGSAIDGGVLQGILNFCHLQTEQGFDTECVLGCSPLTDTSLAARKTRVTLLKNNAYMQAPSNQGSPTLQNTDGDTNVVDAGRYLHVIAGPQVLVSDAIMSFYQDSGAVQYAALLTNLQPQDAPTLKTLPGVGRTVFTFSPRQIDDLSGGQGTGYNGGAYVVFAGGVPPAVNMGVTAASRTSSFGKTQTYRVLKCCAGLVKAAVKPYLGQSFSTEHQMSMNMAVRSAMEAAKDYGIILGGYQVGYDYSISQTQYQSMIGQVSVALRIRPAYELDWVLISVQVTQ